MNADKLLKAERMIKRARSSIGKFCMEECSAYCCRKGFIIMNLKESKTMLKDLPHNPNMLNLKNGDFKMLLTGNGCPRLDENFGCTIHKKRNRPEICKTFPILIKGHNVVFMSDCPAVANNKFYKLQHDLNKIGFNCVYY